jgi:hypothetical protein
MKLSLARIATALSAIAFIVVRRRAILRFKAKGLADAAVQVD